MPMYMSEQLGGRGRGRTTDITAGLMVGPATACRLCGLRLQLRMRELPWLAGSCFLRDTPTLNPRPRDHDRSIREVVEGTPMQLVESVAESIAWRVLDEQSRVERITVAISKPHVAVRGVVGSLGVEISRSREDRGEEGGIV